MVLEQIASCHGRRREHDARNRVLRGVIAEGRVVDCTTRSTGGFIEVVVGQDLCLDQSVSIAIRRRHIVEGKVSRRIGRRGEAHRIAERIGAGQGERNTAHAFAAFKDVVVVIIGIDRARDRRRRDLDNFGVGVVAIHWVFAQRITKGIDAGRNGGCVLQISRCDRA